MTIQTNVNPFGTASQQQPAAAANLESEFIMHTMQDDLASNVLSFESQGSFSNDNKTPSVKAAIPTTTPQYPAEKATSATQSPFNEAPLAQAQTAPVKEAPLAKKLPPMVEVPVIQKIKLPTGNLLYKLLFSAILLIIIAIVGFGYYFYNSQVNAPITPATPPVAVTPEQTPPEQTKPTEQITPTVPTEKYSTNNPNYLPIDFSSVSTADIEAQLVTISTEIKNAASSNPSEFIVVDKNNNPVTLKTFADAVKLTFLPSVFSKLSQDFSLFFYNDNGTVRLGLKIKTASNAKLALQTEMQKQEKTLTSDLAFLFLNTPIEKPQNLFATSSYNTNNEQVRYLNINSDKTLSIDYMVTSDALFIGSSKDTLRVIYVKQPTTIQSNDSTTTPADASTSPSTPTIQTKPIAPPTPVQATTPTLPTN